MTAIICPQPPNIFLSTNNATSPNKVWKLNDVIRYTCDSGYLFENGHSMKDVRCTESSEWSETRADCTSK